jgi:hypothetical protein
MLPTARCLEYQWMKPNAWTKWGGGKGGKSFRQLKMSIWTQICQKQLSIDEVVQQSDIQKEDDPMANCAPWVNILETKLNNEPARYANLGGMHERRAFNEEAKENTSTKLVNTRKT